MRGVRASNEDATVMVDTTLIHSAPIDYDGAAYSSFRPLGCCRTNLTRTPSAVFFVGAMDGEGSPSSKKDQLCEGQDAVMLPKLLSDVSCKMRFT
eukprot:scaffold2512_cov120-Cylindrotheca_fusiformis.AAC.5